MKRFFALALLGLVVFAGCGEQPKETPPAGGGTTPPAGDAAPGATGETPKP